MAALVGSAFAGGLHLIGVDAGVDEDRLILDMAAALSVGLGMLLIVVTNTEHPPAAATTLGLVIQGWVLRPSCSFSAEP